MQYENRIVAFIDILGFKKLIDGTVTKAGHDIHSEISKLDKIFQEIEEHWGGNRVIPSGKALTVFSDSIVVSVPSEEPSQVFYTLLEIKTLIMILVYHGVLVRGAVAHGKLLHRGSRVFGPALVDAYQLESKAAHYPRVILENDLVELAKSSRQSHHSPKQEEKYVKSLLERDSDGMFFIDYFHKAESELGFSEYDFPEYIERLGSIIRKGMMGSGHKVNADIRIKYYWMRERYNHMVGLIQRRMKTLSLGSFEDPELFDFYSNLKTIGS